MTWTTLTHDVRMRSMPPRNLEDAAADERPLMIAAAVRDEAGAILGWALRWSSRDQPTHLHADVRAATDAGDRLVAKLERHAGLALAAQAGMARGWTFDLASVGGGAAFVHPAHPGARIVRDAFGGTARLERDGVTLASHADPGRLSRSEGARLALELASAEPPSRAPWG